MSEKNPPENTIEFQLGQKLMTLYGDTVFGELPKKRVDLALFDALVKKCLKTEKIEWWDLTPEQIRNISINLRITEVRVNTLIEQSALEQNAANIEKEKIFKQIEKIALKTRQDEKDLRDGKFRIFITNRVMRSAIESLLVNAGGITETSFNKGQLIIRFGDLLLALGDQGSLDYLKIIAAKVNEEKKDSPDKIVLEKLNEKTFKEQVNDIGKILAKRFIGEGADQVIGSIFDYIGKDLLSIKK